MHILGGLCQSPAFLEQMPVRDRSTTLTPLAQDSLLMEGRLAAKKSHANTCAAFMRSTVLLKNLPTAPGDHHREVFRCFLTFSEFTACRIQGFRHCFRIALQRFLLWPCSTFLGSFPLMDKGMGSVC